MHPPKPIRGVHGSPNRTLTVQSSIRAVIEFETGGRFVTMGFPGLSIGLDGSSYIDPLQMTEIVSALSELRAELVLSFTEGSELPENALADLKKHASKRKIDVLTLPITDFEAPGPAFMEDWVGLRPTIRKIIEGGGAVAATCLHGAGRSGTIAALLLIEYGLEPEESIDLVRGYFPESIESDAQISWLKGQRACKAGASSN